MAENPARQPKGIPVGGQFASHERTEPELDLGLPAALDVGLCARHGGRWGDDETCMDCTDPNGQPRRADLIDYYEFEHDFMSARQLREKLGLAADEPLPEDAVRYTETGFGLVDSEDGLDLDDDDLGMREDGLTLPFARQQDDGTFLVTASYYENLRWDDTFTEDELDLAMPLVEAFFEEQFGAELNVPDSWDSANLEFAATFHPDEFSPMIVANQFDQRAQFAKFRNQSDPGTYGSPYAYAELKRQIDRAVFSADRWSDLALSKTILPSQIIEGPGVTDAEALALAGALAGDQDSALGHFATKGWARDRDALRAEAEKSAQTVDHPNAARLSTMLLSWIDAEEARRDVAALI